MKRIAIILDKNLEQGAAANAAALLMGQAVLNEPGLYSDQPVLDQSGVQHAGIRYSTAILKAGENQLINLVKSCSEDKGGLKHLVVGVIVWGEDELVRAKTKEFSVIK